METEANFPFSSPNEPVASSSASIVNRISKSFGSLSLNAAVQILGQISIVPVALYAWGKVRYGEWILLTGLVTFLRLTDLGLQTFVVNRMCASYARGERNEMQRDLSNALSFQIPLVSLGILCCAVIVLAIPLGPILDFETVGGKALSIAAMMLIIELLIGVPMGVIGGIYRASGRLARAALIGTFQQLALLGSTIGLIAWGVGFASLATARVVVAVVISGFILQDLRRLYPWLRLSPTGGDWWRGAKMIGPGLFFILIPLADYLSTQFTLLLVQGSLDGGEVSRLATHRTVVNMAMMISGLLTTAIWPELTALHARSQTDQLIKTHRSLARMNMWLVGGVALGMLPFLPLIYPAWTAGRLSIDRLTLGFLVSRVLLWGIWSASMTLLCAINKQKAVAVALICAGVLTSLLSLFLIPKMGISGAALAQLLGDLCVSAWFIPVIAAKETRDRVGQLFGSVGVALVTGILVPLTLGVIGWRLIPSDPVRLFVLVPVVVLVAVSLMWVQLASYERSHLFRLLRSRFA